MRAKKLPYGGILAVLLAIAFGITIVALSQGPVSDLAPPLIRVDCKGRRTFYSTAFEVPVKGDCRVSLVWPASKDSR